MTDEADLITPGGNLVCPKCGQWYGPGGTHTCSDEAEHFRATWDTYRTPDINVDGLTTEIARMGWPKPTIYKEHETIHVLLNLIDQLRARTQPTPKQTAVGKSAVQRYSDRCAIMRVEPTTQGLNAALTEDQETTQTVWRVTRWSGWDDEGPEVLGVCDSADTAKELAVSQQDDYYGKPLEWAALPNGDFQAFYNSGAHIRGHFLVEAEKVLTKKDL